MQGSRGQGFKGSSNMDNKFLNLIKPTNLSRLSHNEYVRGEIRPAKPWRWRTEALQRPGA
jgi:hypothetical protein